MTLLTICAAVVVKKIPEKFQKFLCDLCSAAVVDFCAGGHQNYCQYR